MIIEENFKENMQISFASPSLQKNVYLQQSVGSFRMTNISHFDSESQNILNTYSSSPSIK